MIKWQNNFEAVLTDRTSLADTYIKLAPIPTPDEGRLVLEDNSASNYEIIHYTSKDASGVYTTNGGARNEDGNSNGIHNKGARVRMNMTAQDMQDIKDIATGLVASESVESITSAATVNPLKTRTLITALAVNITLSTINDALKTDGKAIIIRIKDNGTARNIAFTSQYRAIGLTLPTATVANKMIYIAGMYNLAADKVDIIAIAREA